MSAHWEDATVGIQPDCPRLALFREVDAVQQTVRIRCVSRGGVMLRSALMVARLQRALALAVQVRDELNADGNVAADPKSNSTVLGSDQQQFRFLPMEQDAINRLQDMVTLSLVGDFETASVVVNEGIESVGHDSTVEPADSSRSSSSFPTKQETLDDAAEADWSPPVKTLSQRFVDARWPGGRDALKRPVYLDPLANAVIDAAASFVDAACNVDLRLDETLLRREGELARVVGRLEGALRDYEKAKS